MIIKKITEHDIEIVAGLHLKYLDSPGSHIGMPYLTNLYRIISSNDNSLGLIATENQTIHGMLSLNLDNHQFKKKLLRELLSINVTTAFIYAILFKRNFLSSFLDHIKFDRETENKLEIPNAYITGLFVIKESRQKGIAKSLIKKAERELKQKKISRLYVDTLAKNDSALKFYRALGFKEVHNCFGSILLSKKLPVVQGGEDR